ncbi:hypothetical protein HZS_1238, partial [Henneguya salminicola]
MPVILVLDNSLSMGLKLTEKAIEIKSGEDISKINNSKLEYAKKGLVFFLKKLKSCAFIEKICLLTYSSKMSLRVPLTNKIKEVVYYLEAFNIINNSSNISDTFINLKEFVEKNFEKDQKVDIILVTDSSHTQEKFKIRAICACDDLNAFLTVVCLTENIIKNKENLSNLSTKNSRLAFCELNIREIHKYFAKLALKICNSSPVIFTCGNITSPLTRLIPALSLEIYSPLIEYTGSYTIKIAGFLDHEDVVFPVTQTKHLIVCRKVTIKSDIKPNILVLLEICLYNQKKIALVILGNGEFGLIYSVKRGAFNNLVLYTLPKNSYLPWLGPWEQLGPSSDLFEQVYCTDREGFQTSPFPIIEGIECSYCQNDINYLLKKPNIENFEKLKNICNLYAIPEVIKSIATFLEDSLTDYNLMDQPVIQQLCHDIKN